MIEDYKLVETAHLREENRHLRCKVTELEAQLKALKWEWPKEDRINVVGQNGNNGEHYAKLDKSHTKGG